MAQVRAVLDGWKAELVDASVRRNERLPTRVSAGMIGHAQVLQKLLHPALAHLFQVAMDRAAAHSAAAGITRIDAIAIKALLALARSIIRLIRRIHSLLARLCKAAADCVQLPQPTPSSPPSSATAVTAARCWAVHAVHALVRSVQQLCHVWAVSTAATCAAPVVAADYASLLLFTLDFGSAWKTGSFPEELCLGLRRHHHSSNAGHDPSESRAREGKQGDWRLARLQATAPAVFVRALLRSLDQVPSVSPALQTMRTAVELAALISSALQVRSFVSVDSALFAAGITDATTAHLHATAAVPASAAGSTAEPRAVPRKELEAWIAARARQHLQRQAPPARQLLSFVADTAVAVLPPLAISALPRVVAWMDDRQAQRQQQRQRRENRRELAATAARGTAGRANAAKDHADGDEEDDEEDEEDDDEDEDEDDGDYFVDEEGDEHGRRPSLLSVVFGNTGRENSLQGFPASRDGPARDRGAGEVPSPHDVVKHAQQRQRQRHKHRQCAEGSAAGIEDGPGSDVQQQKQQQQQQQKQEGGGQERPCVAVDIGSVRGACALCSATPVCEPCVVPTAGLMCCFACARASVCDRGNRCPFTNLPLDPNTQLIRIYDQDE